MLSLLLALLHSQDKIRAGLSPFISCEGICTSDLISSGWQHVWQCFPSFQTPSSSTTWHLSRGEISSPNKLQGILLCAESRLLSAQHLFAKLLFRYHPTKSTTRPSKLSNGQMYGRLDSSGSSFFFHIPACKTGPEARLSTDVDFHLPDLNLFILYSFGPLAMWVWASSHQPGVMM